mgnify:CR=1 FL=1
MGFAAIGHHTTRQRTFEASGRKVTIKSINRTWKGNAVGFYVYINGQRFFSNTLLRQDAEASAFAKWVKAMKKNLLF